MSSAQTNADDYEDHRKHLARHPHEILAAWVFVSALAAAIFLGISPTGQGTPQTAANAAGDVVSEDEERAPRETPRVRQEHE